ncbi:MAG: hypothetical protein CVV42_10370 [Candidatus Riflebacteria bacterium HGW-Riflebacteria-2]|nr:MAG: hypothetical protein CVV42_10370 [Candidatus Riflebacteria bacterium HGW-Riflebacteria-2]
MKKFFLFALMVSAMMVFTGCAGNGSGTGTEDMASVLSSDDIAGIEASLLADRVLAASVVSDGDPSLLASVGSSEGMMRYRNRQYRSQNGEAGLGLQRGTGSCMAIVSANSMSVGLEQCSIEKLETGEIVITRGNGTAITIPAPDESGDVSSLTVGEIIWEVTYGDDGEPLVEIKNTRSGVKLNINESDDGTLTIVRDLSEVFRGRWAENGDLELNDNQGKRFRYRYGKAN